MKLHLLILLLIFQHLANPVKAFSAEDGYSTIIKRHNNTFEFYLLFNQKDSLLVQIDSFEESYYGDRKIPDSILTSINRYNNNEIIIYWSENNTISEGETGGSGTLKKFISVMDIAQKKEVFRCEIYIAETDWHSETNNETGELKTDSNLVIQKQYAVFFSKQKIIVNDLKNNTSEVYLYNTYQKKYLAN